MKKVLICDDEPHILESVSYVVRKLGHECLTATNGEEALRCAREDRPDLLVLDVRMPKLDGYSVCEQLKSDASTRNIYIIMLTAFGQKQDERIAGSVGADEFITKPFSPRHLKARLSALLGNAENRQ